MIKKFGFSPVLLVFILLTWLVSCSYAPSSEAGNNTNTGVHNASTVTRAAAAVNLTGIQQIIDGFGAATVWNGQLSDAEMDASFGNGTGQMGLTICRIRFDPSGPGGADNDEISNSIKAKARGAVILASVWSPPASMKDNTNTIGGSLNASSYAAYAAWLSNEKSSFGNIDIVSIQNEPNISVNYESCNWTAAQLQTFCQNNAQNIGGSVMMPEAYNFDVNYSDPTLNNSTSASHIAYIGGHVYGASPFNYTNAISKGKKVWMTEHYYDPDDIGTCMTMAKEINDCMDDNMNAYVWWYLKQPNCNLINSGGGFNKKGYIMAQYSKFVRPGYQRVDATYNPSTGVYISAYKGSKVVIVAVNQGSSSVSQDFTFQNGTVTNLTRYTTSGSKSLNNDGTVTVTNNSFTAVLDAQSVTTFVETGSAVSSSSVSLSSSAVSSSRSSTASSAASSSRSSAASSVVSSSRSSAVSSVMSSSSSSSASVASSTASSAGGGYAVNYTVNNDWGAGATVSVTIKNNTAAAVNGWTLVWTFAGNQTITQIWNAADTQSGATVTVKNMSYNNVIGANGGTQGFGFNLSYSSANAKPVAFTLNGTSCTLY